MGIILWIIFGALAGWIASKIMKRDESMGAMANIIVGIIGALIGNFIFDALLGASGEGSIIGQLIVAVIGACILIWVVRLVRGRA